MCSFFNLLQKKDNSIKKSIFNSHFILILKFYCSNLVVIMKKFIQGAVLPFTIFSAGLLLIGCEQNVPSESTTQNNKDEAIQSNSSESSEAQTKLTNGNMFYIVRDVADMQLKAGEYIEQLKQTQSSLENAVSSQDHQQLQAAATKLQTQLKDLNQVLESLNLKSEEIDNIRANILSANAKVLSSPFLNGNVDLSQVDLDKIGQQIGSIQNEMIKLAGMMISSSNNEVENKS